MSRREREAATPRPTIYLDPANSLRDLLGDQVRLVDRRDEADIIVWTQDQARSEPMPVGPMLNVLDVRGAAPGKPPPGAGLLLVGSEAEFGAWAAVDVPIAIVPPVIAPRGEPCDGLSALHIVAGTDAAGLAERACAWARARDLPCGLADAAGVRGLALLARAGPAPELVAGAVLLDVRSGADRLGVPDALLQGLAQGAPVLFCDETPLAHALAQAGAAMPIDDLEAGLDAFAALAGPRRREMSPQHSPSCAPVTVPRRRVPSCVALCPQHSPGRGGARKRGTSLDPAAMCSSSPTRRST